LLCYFWDATAKPADKKPTAETAEKKIAGIRSENTSPAFCGQKISGAIPSKKSRE
jgi:hypothetical protein